MGWRGGSLQIDEDERFPLREWRLQRIGWGVLALLVAAALAGLFGAGPLSYNRETDASGLLTVGYDRFVRHSDHSAVTLLIDPAAIEGGSLTVRVSPEWLAALRLGGITPRPSSRISQGAVEFTFATVEPNEPVTVTFDFIPEDIGVLDGFFALPHREPVTFWQFSYP